ncbi:MAG TPA: nucleoside-diphosphate sugar epimerase/dehydratase [Rhodospirillales bacterium]|jgi:O-antigen biosynthesis protein WbqV|nr:nucleoside-diphosphate sugar epimerase/dehydratase [Rhodospirillales bacterium]
MLAKISVRGYVAYSHDIIMAAASFAISLYLRLGEDLFYYSTAETLTQAGVIFTAIAASVFLFMGLYRGVWRYASLNDLLGITRSATLVMMIFLLVMFLWTRLDTLPRSLPVINWFVLMALLGGPRFCYRLLKDRRLDIRMEKESHTLIPVLLVGVGDGAELFIRSMARSSEANYRVVGIIAEDSSRVGRHIHGVNILGTIDEMATIVNKLAKRNNHPRRLILTRDDMDKPRVRQLLEETSRLGMTLARLPKLTDFRSSMSEEVEVKPIALEDLLGRPQTALDRDAMRALIEHRRILITGAGGCIGSELARQVSSYEPAELILVDHSEYNLYTIDMEMAERHPRLKRRAFLADVRERDRIMRIFAEIRPELVFHAAALKHVPLVENNIFEGAATNIIGTIHVADASIASKVLAMVLISTDKAVHPTSVMGATKRIAEQYCQALDISPDNGDGTRFLTVRFGNVLGSSGSVVPLFQKQLANGGPITVTDPRMKRYFMTEREAVELVLQASALGQKNLEQQGKIFVLDMGEPVLIIELAKQMISLAGLKPGEDVEITIIGPRPGEKLAEEVFYGGEQLVPTKCPEILLAAPHASDAVQLASAIDELTIACSAADRDQVVAIIRRLVPEYKGRETANPSPASG